MGYLSATDDVSFDNMKRAIIAGSALASYTVEKFGTQKLMEINSSMLEERMNEFVKLSEFSAPVLV